MQDSRDGLGEQKDGSGQMKGKTAHIKSEKWQTMRGISASGQCLFLSFTLTVVEIIESVRVESGLSHL